MKIIDLLNKIANGEKVPDAIKWGCHDFEWYVYEYKAKGESGEATLLDYLSQCPTMLNDEIRTFYKIEEKKIPEKLEGIDSLFKIEQGLDLKGFLAWQKSNNKIIENKINEIIDYLDYLKSKGE